MSEYSDSSFDLAEALGELSDVGWEGLEEGRDCMAYSLDEDVSINIVKEFGEGLREAAEVKGLVVEVEEDAFGNIYVTLKGKSDREFIICSHVDGVYSGGRFDGVVGVISGLEVISRLIKRGEVPEKSIRVAAFRAEESSATNQSCLGSALATGQIDADKLNNLRHNDFANERILKILMGIRGLTKEEVEKELSEPFLNADKIDGGIEVHIEQSGILENEGKAVGVVVEGIGAARRSDVRVDSNEEELNLVDGVILRVTFAGFANHSGGTPMNGELVGNNIVTLRKDALVEASKFFAYLEEKNIADIEVVDGSVNTVPGKCTVVCVVHPDKKDAFLQYAKLYKGLAKVNVDVVDPKISKVDCIREEVSAAALNIISEVETIAIGAAVASSGQVRATVGTIKRDGSALVMGLDQRKLHKNPALLLQQELLQMQKAYERDPRVSVVESPPVDKDPVRFKPEIPQIIKEEYRAEFGEDPIELGSMPGHDLSNILTAKRDGSTLPGGMIYVRSLRGGISHNPQEWSEKEDIKKAADLLYRTIKRLCC